MRRVVRDAAVGMAFLWWVACAPTAGMETASSPTPAPPEPPPPAAVVEPVGTYTFSTVYAGAPLDGKILIRGEPDRYTGAVVPVGGPGPVEIYAVTVDGQTLTVFGDAGGDDLIITMKFDGDAYTGSWALGFEGGEMKGSRVTQEP